VYQPSGFGFEFDLAFSVALAVVVGGLIALVISLVLLATRQLPLFGTGLLLASSAVITAISFPLFTVTLAGLALSLCVAAAVLGATIATVMSRRLAESSRVSRAATHVLLVTAAGFIAGFVSILADDGDLENLSSWRPRTELMPPTLSVSNPAAPGEYAVRTLVYGAGTDIRRPEYGPSVAIRSSTVDASGFFRNLAGWRRWVRRQYWGFDVDTLPLNARVWYPEGSGPFPLVLIVHGNHRMSDFSDPGYQYLGELLASRGFILASVDENFLNGSVGPLYNPMAPELFTERTVRGWLLLEHLRLWHEWNQDSAHPFYEKVDVNRIALMGHSRGGEAAATAALFNRMQYYPEDATIRFNYNFGVRAIVAMAPADGQYQPAGQPRWIEDVSYLTLQGGHDADVDSFAGSRQADRVRYTSSGPWFSTEIWAYRANHGQFNTGWGRADFSSLRGWFLNLQPLMPGDEQRRISKTYISAFLETTLKERREYRPLFQDWRTGRHWLPETTYINRYRDASFVPLATFDEDADLASATARGGAVTSEGLTLWREGRIPTRESDRGRNGVFLGWHHAERGAPAVYSIALPQPAARNWRLTERSTFELSIASVDQNAPVPPGAGHAPTGAGDREAPDFTIELVANDGTTLDAPLRRFAEVPPPLRTKFTKVNVVERDQYGRDWEPVFQTVRAPLAAFAPAGGPPFDPQKVVAVRLRFDRTVNSVIRISAIGFGSEEQ
jgi:dienelactone hydrolase